MKNYFILITTILSFFFIFSCETNEIQEIDNTISNKEKFNYEKFYKDYKGTIQNMNRNELSGLNRSILVYAMNDFSEDKILSLWKEKIEKVAENKSLSEMQKLFLKNFSNKLTKDFYRNLRHSEDNAIKVENEFYKNGFSKKQIINIAYNLGDLDINNEPKYLLIDDSKIANEETLAILNKNTKQAKCDPTVDCDYYEDDGGAETKFCSSYACWTCSPISDCTNNCVIKFKSCGLLSAFDCHARCY